jgi:hypothetical protein
MTVREQFDRYYEEAGGCLLATVKQKHWETWQAAQAALLAANGPAVEMRVLPDAGCECRSCLEGKTFEVGGRDWPILATRMVLCATCGNKRCPHANDCRNACTNSNEPGQPGSAYA